MSEVDAARIAALEQECMIGVENAPLVVVPETNETYLEEPARVRTCEGSRHTSRESAQLALFQRLDAGDRRAVTIWPCAGHWHIEPRP